MDTIEMNIQLLVGAIKKSPEYKAYKAREAELSRHPELWDRVDRFCARNFHLQNNTEPKSLFEELDRMNRESQELRKIPEVSAYLQAELNLCKLLQNISLDINGSLGIHIPKL